MTEQIQTQWSVARTLRWVPHLTLVACICFEFCLLDYAFYFSAITQCVYFGFALTSLNGKPLCHLHETRFLFPSPFTVKIALPYLQALTFFSLSLVFRQLIVIFAISLIFKANLSSWFHSLEQQAKLQPCRRHIWVWHRRDQIANILDHILLQDLSRYEDWPENQLCCHL